MAKLFIVTKTDFENSSGGYRNTECFPFQNKENAQKKFKELRDKEIDELENADGGKVDYSVYEDTDSKFEVSWYYGDEEVLIYLHEVELCD